MNDRLRTTAVVYGAVIAIHLTDHLRRGIDASPRSVLVLGLVALAFQALAIGAVLTRHRLAAVLALAVALPDAIGVVVVHLLPGGSDALVGGDPAPGATAFSVVTAAAEVAAGLALAWVAWTVRDRGLHTAPTNG